MRRPFLVVTTTASILFSGFTMAVVSSPVLALPAGFTDTQVANPPGNSLSSPTSITALPGGRALILEKGGNVRILQNDGSLLATDALSLTVCSGGEMGLLGAAVDPAFTLNGFVYLYYTRNAGSCGGATGRANRVSRFSMIGNTIIPASEVVLLDNIPATGGNHNGGDLEVGQDGYLYVAIGDAGTNPRGLGGTSAQDFSLLTGKIVRIGTDGSVPPDNPFVGLSNSGSCAMGGLAVPSFIRCTEIYSYGLRNPYRFAFDTNTGGTRFFINDVGQGTWEEVNDGIKGANYGWASREGPCVTGSTTNCPAAPPGVTDPLTAYSHNATACTFITAGIFVPNGIWPSQFDGSYLFADGGCGDIFMRTAAGAVNYASPFHETSGGIVDMAFVVHGTNPALYYVTNSTGQLRRVTYDAPAATTSSTLAYQSLGASTRVYDTRDNTGVPAGTIRGGTTRLVDLGLDDPDLKAALVNLTMVQPLGTGFVWASQARTEYPSTSNINASSAEFVANASIVPIDPDGNIVVFASTTTNFVVDVMGVFREVGVAESGGRFTALSPVRLADTRIAANGSDNAYSRVNASPVSTVNVAVAGRGGVPGAVTAVALIATGLSNPGSVAGHVTVYPGGTPVPLTSNLNVNGDGDVRPNLVIVPLGLDGSVNLRLVNAEHVVVDVAGYFTDTTTAEGLYHVIAPTRQVDTRLPFGFGPLPIGTTQSLDPGGAIPATASAISQNVTMTLTIGPGFVTAYPADESRPLASNGNASAANQDRASLTLTKVGGGGAGSVAYFSSGGTDLVVDITGYFD